MTGTDQATKDILIYINSNDDVKRGLFYISPSMQDYSPWLNNVDESDKEGIYNVEWLFIANAPVGLRCDGMIIGVTPEGEVFDYCKGLQNLPYELIRQSIEYTSSEAVGDYFDKNDGYKTLLSNFEVWCADNGIELDSDCIFHQKDGQLFSHFFDK